MTINRFATLVELTIAESGSESGVFQARGNVIFGIITPGTLTGTAFTFKAADREDGTFQDVYDSDGNQVSVSAAADRALGLSGAEADALAPWNWLKLVSNDTEAAERTIFLVMK